MQTEQQARAVTSNSEYLPTDRVFDFLNAHPDFFAQHPDLLERLSIPHESGQAVSLIERQVGMLRQRSQSLESRLADLIDVARENEALHQRVHELVQELISAESVDAVLSLARRHLLEAFRADRVSVLLFGQDESQVPLFADMTDDLPLVTGQSVSVVSKSDVRIEAFKEVLNEAHTRCGDLDLEQMALLFGARPYSGSCALIPLVRGDNMGLVVLESNDQHRFTAGKGVMFLDQLGAVLSRRLHALQ